MQAYATARVVLLDPSGRMLLVKRSATDPAHAGTWDIPGGQVEENETFEAAAVRETQEEVGVTVSGPQLIFATSDIRSGASKSWLFFVAQLPESAPIVLSHEHNEYQWIKPQELATYTDYDILLRFHAFVTTNHLLEKTE